MFNTFSEKVVASIAGNLLDLKRQISEAEADAGRDPDSTILVAASKARTADTVLSAYAAGVRHFGENYVDEAVTKITSVKLPHATWHFIGRIQSNKTRHIVRHFDWVHTIDRIKIADRLASQREHTPLNVLIQVNIDKDPAKAGVMPENIEPLVQHITALPNLRLRGLMTILNQTANSAASYDSVAQLAAQIRGGLPSTQGQHWDTLSMGMSGDIEAAILAGATHVRIGTALFGPRTT